MTRNWLLGLAITLGFMTTATYGQYPGGYNNFGPNTYGPSAYPVNTQSVLQNAPQVPQNYNAHQSAYGSAGEASGQFQLVANQEQVYGGSATQPLPMTHNLSAPMSPPVQYDQHSNHATMSPQQSMQSYPAAPMQHGQPLSGPIVQGGVDSSCQSCTQPAQTYMAPTQSVAPSYGYTQSLAPNCTSCGPAPVSQGYMPSFAPTVAHQGPRLGGLGGLPAQAKPWFFGGGLLVFNRVDNKGTPLSFFDSAYAPDVLTTRDARQRAAAGIEGTIGRYFNCGRNAISVTYWGAFPEDQTVTRARSTAGDYRSRIPFTYMTMAGTPSAPTTPYSVYDWYDNAFTHSLQRSFAYHNVEVNLIGFAMGGAARTFNLPTAGTLFSGTRGQRGGSSCGYCGGAGCGNCASSCESSCNSCTTCAPSKMATGPCCLTAPSCGSRLNLSWIAGLRYFRFEDNLLYAASLADTVINRAADDLYYEVNTTNDLVGFQTGGRLDFCLGKRVNLYGTSRVGIYNNRSTLYSRLGTDFETAYLDDTRTPANPDNGMAYAFDDTKNSVAFLSELGAGAGVRVSPKWTLNTGYRAVIASGVATAPDNVRQSFANYDDVRDFNNYGTLILHGFNIGATYNY